MKGTVIMQMVTLKIGGMTCNHCVKAVTDAISNCDGTANVRVNLERGDASFEYEEGLVTLDEIKAAVAEEGYEV